VFTQATVWGIDPFDQFGVELGKTIAAGILPAVRGEDVPLHPASRHLLDVIRKLAAAP
jgi:glucose-6-phosphate isomerase